MKTNIIRYVAVAAVLLSVAFGTGSVLAQDPGSGSTPAQMTPPCCKEAAVSEGAAVPAGYTVIPPDDSDRADDQIVQLENLRIQSLSGSVPGTIYASRDIGGPCREYLDVGGSSGSRIFPCPLAPTVLYQLSVQSDTILLLKDRTRARIGSFTVGDRINVFGFLDPGTSGVQALIIRDLDKPAQNSQYVQLNGLTVVSAPDSSVAPASLQVARKGVEPCLSFLSMNAARGMPAPCPMGVEAGAMPLPPSVPVAANMTMSGGTEPPAAPQIYPAFHEYYNVQIGSAARVMNASRQPLGLSGIQAGDLVNIYGRYNPGNRTIEAMIVRDLSVPRGAARNLLTVTVSNNRIVCVTTPCGQIDGARIDVRLLEPLDDDTPDLVASGYTTKGEIIFEGLKAGRYAVGVSATGYASAGEQVILASDQPARVSLFMSPLDEAPEIQVLHPNGGETLRRGSNVNIRWRPEARISNVADIFLLADRSGCLNAAANTACLAVVDPQYTIARRVGQPASDGTMSYSWSVPNTFEKILLQDGNYYLKICYAGTSTCDLGDRTFKITASAPR